MGIGKIGRGLGKVGLLIEGGAYVVTAMRALVKAVKGDPAARRDDGVQQDRDADTRDRPERQ